MTSSFAQRLLLISNDLSTTASIRAQLAEYADTTFGAASQEDAFDLLHSGHWDLVICCTGRQPAKGLDLILKMQAENMLTCVLVVADNPSVEDAVLAMRMGCSSYLDSKGITETLRPAIIQGMQRTTTLRTMAEQRIQDRSSLRLAQSRVMAMEGQIRELQQSVMHSLMSALEVREPGSRVHSLRLCAYARHLARAINYPENLLPHLEHACMLHDIGKLNLPIESLNNPGILPASQLEALKPHTIFGEKILNSITFLRPAARLVRHHHERFDGSGYPDRLASENIPLGSRIISLVDALDAITNEQTYRPAQSFRDAVSEISRWSRRQFDPMLIEAFRIVPLKTWARLRRSVEETEDTGAIPLSRTHDAPRSAPAAA